jgi:hypothetical protein
MIHLHLYSEILIVMHTEYLTRLPFPVSRFRYETLHLTGYFLRTTVDNNSISPH